MTLSFGKGLKSLSLIALAVAAVLELISPLLVKHLGYDGFHGLLWIDSFAALLKQGVLYPRWLPDSYGGLGSPTFYFYPPLAFYLSSIFKLAIPDLGAQTIYNILAFVLSISSVLTSYLFVRSLTCEKWLALTGAFLYGFAPMRAHTLYTRSSISEHLAFVWVPLIALGILRLLESDRPRRKDLLLLSTSWALLLLSHIPTSIVVAITSAVFVLVRNFSQPKKVLWPFLGILLGGLLSAFYLLPVTYFGQFVQLNKLTLDPSGPQDVLASVMSIATGGNYTDSFVSLLGYGGILLVGLLFLFEYRTKSIVSDADYRKLLLPFCLAAFVIVFFENASISHLVWKLTHLNQVIQFTWRWNIPGLLVVVSAYVILRSERSRTWLSLIVLSWSLGAILVAGLQILDIRAHARTAQRTPFDPPEYAPSSANSNDTFVIKFGQDHTNDLFLGTADTTIHWMMIEATPTQIRLSVTALRPTEVVFHHWYWPTWQLKQENAEAPIATRPDSAGRARAVLSAGSYQLTYQLVQAPIEQAGWALSGAALIALLLISFKLGNPKSVDEEQNG